MSSQTRIRWKYILLYSGMHGGHSGKELSSSHALGRISSACVQSGSGQLASHAVIETGKADQKNATECACVHPRIAASQPANPLQPATQSVATTQPAKPVGRCRRQIMYGCNARHIFGRFSNACPSYLFRGAWQCGSNILPYLFHLVDTIT